MLLNAAIGADKPNSLMGEYSIRLGEAVLRNRTREAEQTARIHVQLANKVKSEFIANMSHELRTPLNTIIGFSKLLGEHDQRRLTDRDILDYARLIQDAAGHLLSVINDILDISKIQSGKYTLDSQEVSLAEVLSTCIAAHRSVAADSGVTLEYRADDFLPMVRGDAQKLRQVFSNVIGNAIKFTPSGGVVSVDARAMADGATEVTISDTGIGMDQEEVRVALTPFGQVDGGRSRWREGAGLGLPIANALIELHSGNLTISSERGKGTEVTISLPPPQLVSIVQDRGLSLGHPGMQRIRPEG
jgi:two-component system cell cycle sensor histidine kinase PleC